MPDKPVTLRSCTDSSPLSGMLSAAMLNNSRDLQFCAHWCARLANEFDHREIADDLRQISRELILKAQDEAFLKNNAA
jgi:hypothetical protein